MVKWKCDSLSLSVVTFSNIAHLLITDPVCFLHDTILWCGTMLWASYPFLPLESGYIWILQIKFNDLKPNQSIKWRQPEQMPCRFYAVFYHLLHNIADKDVNKTLSALIKTNIDQIIDTKKFLYLLTLLKNLTAGGVSLLCHSRRSDVSATVHAKMKNDISCFVLLNWANSMLDCQLHILTLGHIRYLDIQCSANS